MNIWQVLEIEVTHDIKVIKYAYAKKLKTCKPEVDSEGFTLLRSAYEIALKHAAGERVDFELKKNNETESRNRTEDPVALSYKILNLLVEKGEKEAIELIAEFNKQGLLDHLEFSHKFQSTLSVNLLTLTPGYYLFINYVIEFFKWEDSLKYEKDGVTRIAITNLLNQVKPLRFLQYLSYLSGMNREIAKKNNVKWENCYAAKRLMFPPRFYHYPSLKERLAIQYFVDQIENSFPLSLGLGVNLKSFVKWQKFSSKKVKDKKEYKKAASNKIGIIIFIVYILIRGVGFVTNESYKDNTLSSASTTLIASSNVVPPPLVQQGQYTREEKYFRDNINFKTKINPKIPPVPL